MVPSRITTTTRILWSPSTFVTVIRQSWRQYVSYSQLQHFPTNKIVSSFDGSLGGDMTGQKRGIHVLGIESSCDDTGVAIIDQDGKILSNCIDSQLKKHVSLGGIIPVVAREYHVDSIDGIANKAFKDSGLRSVGEDIDAIAVTTRPGLDFSLKVGLNYARTLAKKYSKPLVPVHHMQAHALMPLLDNRNVRFPFMALLISGGHCLLSIAKRYNEFHILGESWDDAPGDLLDKMARRWRLRNLGPPFDTISGGAAIELLGQREGADRFKYFHSSRSIPMLFLPSCDFSFSGYYGNLEPITSVINDLWHRGEREKLMVELSHACASLQRGILIQLLKKLKRAFMFYRMYWRYENEDAFGQTEGSRDQLGFGLLSGDATNSIDLVVSGGVAANKYLIDNIKLACLHEFDQNRVFVPTKALCSDNGAMIAWNGLLRYTDYTSNSNSPDRQIVDCVITTSKQMDLLKTEPVSSMGRDIRREIQARSGLKPGRFSYPEFKLASG